MICYEHCLIKTLRELKSFVQIYMKWNQKLAEVYFNITEKNYDTLFLIYIFFTHNYLRLLYFNISLVKNQSVIWRP